MVIAAYNVAPFLGEALASVQAQTFTDFEAIIIDDGSPDDIAGVAAPFLKDPRFRLFRQDNCGLSAARNRGIALATAPLVAILDGDDRYRPDYLARMVGRLREEDAPHFVTCDAISFGLPANDGEVFSSRYPQDEPITLLRLLNGEVAIFGLCTIVRAALMAVGGYDEGLESAEDLDLWLRLLAADYRGSLVREILVEYRRRADSLSQSSAKLMRETAKAYANILPRLAGRPEAALAEQRRATAVACSQFEGGADMILAGQRRSGVAQMIASGYKGDSAKWRFALSVFSLLPPVALPAIALYRYGNRTAKTVREKNT